MNISLPRRARKTKVRLEHEPNEIYRLLLDGIARKANCDRFFDWND